MRALRVVVGVLLATVGLVALAITLARLIQPSGRYGVGLVAFTPLALPMYAVLLLAAALWMVRRRRWRGAGLPLALLAAGGLGLHAWWFAPQVVGANPPPDPDARSLVVMTANLRLGLADPDAVVERRASLLAAGITGVEGTFHAGEPVALAGPDGTPIARGLVNFDADELPQLLGRSTGDLERELGKGYEREVVHRDDLVLL